MRLERDSPTLLAGFGLGNRETICHTPEMDISCIKTEQLLLVNSHKKLIVNT